MNKNLGWNNVSNWYDNLVGDEGSEYHRFVIFPAIKKILDREKDNIKNLKVIDFACGQGVFCRVLKDLSINEITGLDISSALIKQAKKRGSEGINYITADVTKLLSQNGNLKYDLKTEYYDYLTIILSIQNISPITPVFKAASKLLKKGGSIIIVMMHPSFRIPQYSDWSFNEKEDRQERMIWKYLESEDIKITTNPGKEASGEKSTFTTHYHRPIKSYINTLSQFDLFTYHMEELITHKKEQKGIKSEAIEKSKKEIPLFMLIIAKKI